MERNVEEWAVFGLGRAKKDLRSRGYTSTIVGGDGSELKQRLGVCVPGEYRLPSRFDYDVYSAVLELLEIRGGMPEDGTLRFSLRELILIMGIKPSGRTYEETKRSLRRIAATVLQSDKAFWLAGQQRHISDTFSLWTVRFDSITDKNGSGRRHEIEFGKLLRCSFAQHYIRELDIQLFWSLDSPVAKRLYRLVDLKRDGTASWGTDLFDLQNLIPIGPYAYISKIKEKLYAAHEELVERGFLANVRYYGTSGVEYTVSAAFVDRRKGLESAGTREDYIAIEILIESGLRGSVARDLVAKHGPAHCTLYANALPYQKNLRNPAGWLRKAIEEGFDLPHSPGGSSPEGCVVTEAPSPPPVGASVESGASPPNPDATVSGTVEVDRQPLSAYAAVDNELSSETVSERPSAGAEARAAWDLLTDELAALRGRGALPPWWNDYQGGELVGSTLTVLVPNTTAANYLNDHFGRDLLRFWRKRAGDNAKIEVATSLSSAKREALRDFAR